MSKSNFIIITHPRSGAHLLISLLNSHPNIESNDEVFNKLNVDECKLLYNEYLDTDKDSTNLKGFKIPYNYYDSKKNDIWDKAKKNADFKIIHLHRANLLRAYVSNEIAKKTETWYGTNNQPNLNDKRIKIEVTDCLKWINNTVNKQIISEFDFRHHKSFTLTYENFLFDKNKINDLYRFLDVDPNHTPDTPMKKQNPEPLEQLIINYKEFEESFLNSRWSAFLHDDNSNRYNHY